MNILLERPIPEVNFESILEVIFWGRIPPKQDLAITLDQTFILGF
jgi:hypothetical protein